MYLLGAAARLGNWGHVGFVQGIGYSGITEGLGFSEQLPLEVFFETDLGSRLRLVSWLSDRYLFGEVARNDGADLPVLYGDEVEAGVALRWGKRGEQHGSRYGGGYFMGALYREQLGARYIGATVGYHLNMSFSP